jgi:hypothetical protein
VAKQSPSPQGSWLLAEELLERGDTAFVDELRKISDAEKLGVFAARWHADPRPQARSLLLEYLDRPLNAFRHEALVKRLFKLAEKAGDDAIVAGFLVAFDRSIDRKRRKQHHYDWNTRESWTEETIGIPPGTTLPKDPKRLVYRNPRTGERMPAATPQRSEAMRLFAVHTRHYLRRRVWRYFRVLGKTQPDRYIKAVTAALLKYTDADVQDGLALIDRWGLIHILFGESKALVPQSNGWQLAVGFTLADLKPTPRFAPLWAASPEPLLTLLKSARCRPVRQWTIQMLRQHFSSAIGTLPLAELLQLIGHEDTEIAQLAIEALKTSPDLGLMSVDKWLQLLDAANPQTLEVLCELLIQRLDAGSVTLDQAVQLACSRPLPIARLGLTWLKTKQPTSAAECRKLLALAEAEAEPVRGEAIRWLRDVLSAAVEFQAVWILELLDSRHEDVRREAWTWFLGEPRGRNDVSLWQRLLESPYDDIRLPLVVLLETGARQREIAAIDRSQLDAELIRFLWAAVLLNIHRGSRTKPHVVAQIVKRLERQPAEAPQLLPILSVALRSIRGPEFRAGLLGVVQLVERAPALRAEVRGVFPELEV